MKSCKLLLAAATAAALLGVLTSAAPARNLSTSSQTLRAAWSEVTFEMPFGRTTCQVTLEGSLHARTFAKVVGSLVGYVTSARLGTCSSGSATILRETLPWHVQYESFSGTLPNISRVTFTVNNVSIAVSEPFGIVCLVRLTFLNRMHWAFVVLSQVMNMSALIGEAPAEPTCFESTIRISSGPGSVAVLNSSTAITIRLI